MEKTINVVFATIFGLISLVSLYNAILRHASELFFLFGAAGILSFLIFRDLALTSNDIVIEKAPAVTEAKRENQESLLND
ncbi:MAG: hypothetical protein WC833_08840 [Bacteroidales bacterium]|jgi:DMSO/TMAO reductase YedYZ heme-binding membrane subunit